MTWRPSANLITLSATLVVCAALYAAAAWRYHDLNFFTLQVFLDFFRDNAYLGIAAVGMTFVILSGGIDLSVGAIVGLSGIVLAKLMEQHGWHPLLAVATVVAIGTGFGALQGFLIQTFQLAPFFVTLAGMFFARGLALIVSTESLALENELFLKISDLSIPLGDGRAAGGAGTRSRSSPSPSSSSPPPAWRWRGRRASAVSPTRSAATNSPPSSWASPSRARKSWSTCFPVSARP